MDTNLDNFQKTQKVNGGASEITRSIMHRVWFIYWGRKMFGPFGIKAVFLSLLVISQAFLVSIPSVIYNFAGTTLSNPLGAYDFLISAFKNTQFTVQVISGVIMIAAFFLLRDLIRTKFSIFARSSV